MRARRPLVLDVNGTPRLRHSFTVQYSPTAADVNVVSTLFPEASIRQDRRGHLNPRLAMWIRLSLHASC